MCTVLALFDCELTIVARLGTLAPNFGSRRCYGAEQRLVLGGRASVHDELHDKCAPVVPAIDVYLGNVGKMQALIGEGLSGKVLEENERSRYATYQTIWGIRRNQATETRRIAVCLQDFSRECYAGVAPLADAMEKEDKEVCSLLASVNQKCE